MPFFASVLVEILHINRPGLSSHIMKIKRHFYTQYREMRPLMEIVLEILFIKIFNKVKFNIEFYFVRNTHFKELAAYIEPDSIVP